jgi:hypothetical protein
MKLIPLEKSNRLERIAREIDECHSSFLRFGASVRQRLIETKAQVILCGKLLLEAKQIVGHGAFERWVANNTKISQVTAQRYMRLARELAKASSATYLEDQDPVSTTQELARLGVWNGDMYEARAKKQLAKRLAESTPPTPAPTATPTPEPETVQAATPEPAPTPEPTAPESEPEPVVDIQADVVAVPPAIEQPTADIERDGFHRDVTAMVDRILLYVNRKWFLEETHPLFDALLDARRKPLAEAVRKETLNP